MTGIRQDAWARSPAALRLATIRVRIASTAPSRPLGAPRARPDCAEASQQLSTSLGVAALGTIFLALLKHHPATDALRITSWACLVPLAAAFTCVFLLPKHARDEQRQRH